MRTLYITEAQKNGILLSEKKRKKNIPSAQSQVRNKVNAGIMDAVTLCGTIGEGSEPESNQYKIGKEKNGEFYHVNEAKGNKNSIYVKNCKKIAEFMQKSGLDVYPFPKLHLDWSEQDGIFIKTGYYTPEDKEVTIFCNNRNIKDVLRSFAHEIIHHMQNLRGDNLNFNSNDNVKDNKELEKLEAEAYLKGNIYFRKWTEYENSEKDSLNESKLFENNDLIVPSSKFDSNYLDYNNYIYVIHQTSSSNINSILANGLNTLNGLNGTASFANANTINNIINSQQNGHGHKGSDALVIMAFPKNTFKNIRHLDMISDELFEMEYDFGVVPPKYIQKIVITKSSENMINETKKKTILNDEGVVVPDLCDCGGRIGTYICGEPIYKCSECGKYYGTVRKSLNESDMIEDMNPDDVDLSSFNLKRELNPKFWKNNLLDSRIRLKLLDIADDFIDFLGVDWVEPDDIIITGSLANFNWNKKYSDIDLHVLIDYSKVDKRIDFVKKYFDSLKNEWNEEHNDLNIFGFPVEVYVQDTNEEHASTGVYSLYKNEWITTPKREKLANSKVNKKYIKKKVAKYIDAIDYLIDIYNKNKDNNYKLRKLSSAIEKLLVCIKNERKTALKSHKSEISNGNIIYKTLKRLEYLDKIYSLKSKIYDNLNSLP